MSFPSDRTPPTPTLSLRPGWRPPSSSPSIIPARRLLVGATQVVCSSSEAAKGFASLAAVALFISWSSPSSRHRVDSEEERSAASSTRHPRGPAGPFLFGRRLRHHQARLLGSLGLRQGGRRAGLIRSVPPRITSALPEPKRASRKPRRGSSSKIAGSFAASRRDVDRRGRGLGLNGRSDPGSSISPLSRPARACGVRRAQCRPEVVEGLVFPHGAGERGLRHGRRLVQEIEHDPRRVRRIISFSRRP